MRYGNQNDTIDAINQAKNTRANALGCTETAIDYIPADLTQPSLIDVTNTWNFIHLPQIISFNVSCPRIGRNENNSALGVYYAMQAGYLNGSNNLINIANMMIDQQYSSNNSFLTPTFLL
jgi:hypothetical protein